MLYAALTLRFLIELCALVGLAIAGAAVIPELAVIAPVAAAVIWGRYAAPKAKHRASGLGLVAVKLLVLGGAAAALVAAGHATLGVALAAATALDLLVLRRIAPDAPIPV